MTELNDDEARIRVRELIRDISVAMFVTATADGRLRSRPMHAMGQDADGKTLWFYTRQETGKSADIGHDGRVVLAYSNPNTQDYVSVYGEARVVKDLAKQKDLWSEAARVWFPKGPASEDLALIAVEMVGAEYWDSTSSTVFYAYGYAKTLITGRPPQGGDHGTVSFGQVGIS